MKRNLLVVFEKNYANLTYCLMLLRIIIIVALFFPVHLFAQERFVVQVVDATTGEKLPFAQVYKG
ncbi:MAG: hypothetical protein IJ767_02580, partial [Bacteroidaceae bacterium]|nr:hypothetical protein [Bacteroidaceae bacterium]